MCKLVFQPIVWLLAILVTGLQPTILFWRRAYVPRTRKTRLFGVAAAVQTGLLWVSLGATCPAAETRYDLVDLNPRLRGFNLITRAETRRNRRVSAFWAPTSTLVA